jgi:hypothetical protein
MTYYQTNRLTDSYAQQIIDRKKISNNFLDNFSYSPKLQKIVTLSVYNNSIKICNGEKKTSNSKPPIRVSQDIKKFSNNARRRFIRKLAHINLQVYAKPIFVTLTYHNVLPKSNTELKSHLDKYLQFLRTYTYKFEYVWRLEFQKRGAPHFHIILFPKKGYDNKDYQKWKRDLPAFWRKTIGEWDSSMQLYAVDVQKLDGKKNIFFYLSKYAAKESDVLVDDYKGRMYGFSSTIILKPLLHLEITLQDFERLRKIIFLYMKSCYNLNEQFEYYLLADPSVEILLTLESMKTIVDSFESLKYRNVGDSFFDDFYSLDFDS